MPKLGEFVRSCIFRACFLNDQSSDCVPSWINGPNVLYCEVFSFGYHYENIFFKVFTEYSQFDFQICYNLELSLFLTHHWCITDWIFNITAPLSLCRPTPQACWPYWMRSAGFHGQRTAPLLTSCPRSKAPILNSLNLGSHGRRLTSPSFTMLAR